MGSDGAAASEGVQFLKLSGEPIPLKVPTGSKVRDVKLDLAKILGGGSFRLMDETGKVLEANDVLQGTLQVQRINISEGAWSELFLAACNGFDENKLRAEVRAAWPGDFVRVGEDPKIPIESLYYSNMKMRSGFVGKKRPSKFCNQPSFLLVASGLIIGLLASLGIVTACNMFADPTIHWSPQLNSL